MEKEYKKYSSGKIGGEKINYPDGVGCCIWVKFDEEDGGHCFDFSGEQLPDIKSVIEQLINAEAEEYVPDESYEKFMAKREETKKTWWYRLYDKVRLIGIHFNPFDWKFTRIFIMRPTVSDKQYVYERSAGIYFGPIMITW